MLPRRGGAIADGRKQSSGKSSGRAPVPQPHGGALIPGAGGGTQPGAGRPPSLLREQLRGSFAERRAILERIADGEVIQRGEIPLSEVLKHAACPKCGGELEQTTKLPPSWIKLEAVISANAKERIAAIEVMGKYGLGAVKELSVEHVRDRLRQTIAIIRDSVPEEIAADLLKRLEPLWR